MNINIHKQLINKHDTPKIPYTNNIVLTGVLLKLNNIHQ